MFLPAIQSLLKLNDAVIAAARGGGRKLSVAESGEYNAQHLAGANTPTFAFFAEEIGKEWTRLLNNMSDVPEVQVM